jgi:hypothetical protein
MAAGRSRPTLPGRGRVGEKGEVIGSDLEQLGFLVPQQIVDLVDVLLGHAVEPLLRRRHVVPADVAVLLQLVQRLLGVPRMLRTATLGVLAFASVTLM